MTLLDESDKSFWHGFIDFYEPFFLNRNIDRIAEIGVFKGNSIKWLLSRFPKSVIYGADILPIQREWPVDERFIFTQLDQGKIDLVQDFFSQQSFDLIIEDGSHIPKHQALALIEGIKNLNSGGLYILEDIHTSHRQYNKINVGPFEFCGRQKGNALTALLALMHYREIGVTLDETRAKLISDNSLFTPEDILFLNQNIKEVSFYRRSRLPKKCYSCGGSDYNFSSLRCVCGVEVFSDADSMSFVLERI
jgi:hypothetical protein